MHKLLQLIPCLVDAWLVLLAMGAIINHRRHHTASASPSSSDINYEGHGTGQSLQHGTCKIALHPTMEHVVSSFSIVHARQAGAKGAFCDTAASAADLGNVVGMGVSEPRLLPD